MPYDTCFLGGRKKAIRLFALFNFFLMLFFPVPHLTAAVLSISRSSCGVDQFQKCGEPTYGLTQRLLSLQSSALSILHFAKYFSNCPY